MNKSLDIVFCSSAMWSSAMKYCGWKQETCRAVHQFTLGMILQENPTAAEGVQSFAYTVS